MEFADVRMYAFITSTVCQGNQICTHFDVSFVRTRLRCSHMHGSKLYMIPWNRLPWKYSLYEYSLYLIVRPFDAWYFSASYVSTSIDRRPILLNYKSVQLVNQYWEWDKRIRKNSYGSSTIGGLLVRWVDPVCSTSADNVDVRNVSREYRCHALIEPRTTIIAKFVHHEYS